MDVEEEEEEKKPPESPRSRFPYRNATYMGMRFNLSSRCMALMINATLQDLSIHDESKYISKKRILGMKKKYGEEIVKKHKEKKGHVCLKFDGKTSPSAAPHCQEKKSHLITVVQEPGGSYLDHFECGESGLAVSNALYGVIIDSGSKDSLLALGSGKLFYMLFF